MYKNNNHYLIKIIQEVEEFRRLKDEWNRLAETCDAYTPWLSFDWFNLCLKYSADTSRLLILLVYEADRMVAIAPFIVKTEKFRGTIPTKKIELLGNVHSPIRNVLIRGSNKERKTNILSKIFDYLSHEYNDWDVMELDRIPEENNVFMEFNQALSNRGLRFRTSFSAGNWYLDGIDYPFVHYFENLPKKIQKDVQYCQRRLEKMGNLQFEIIRQCDSLDRYLDLYDGVRGKSWKAPEKDKAFIREFTKFAAAKGWMRLGFLRYNDVPISSQKWIICNKRAYIWDVLFDEEYGKYSPGKILSSEMSRYVFDNDKIVEIDFMTGDDAYKKDWTPKRRERRGFTIFNKTVRGQLLAIIMNKLLPIVEKNPAVLSAKNKVAGYLKSYRKI